MSRVFAARAPAITHLVRGPGGLKGEVFDLRRDVEAGFTQLQEESGGTTADRTALGALLGVADRGHTFFDQTLATLYIWDGAAWATNGGSTGSTGTQVYTLNPVQALTLVTEQLLPVGTYHRFTCAGNLSLTSTPMVNWVGAVAGQVVILHNVGAPGTGHLTLDRSVAFGLMLSNANSRIDEGGSMSLIFTGALWVEFTHTQATST